ncbi:MAG: hypothetical protein U0133_07680 [Gemmatimonadales bacterium]
MDFETMLKGLILLTFAVAIPIAAYAAIMGIKGTWAKPDHPETDPAELDALRDRIAELEASQQRVAELEERVDFAERLLVQQRDPAQLPEGSR